MTGEEYLVSRLQQLRAEARLLAEDEYDPEEMWRFVRDAAALFERFLQAATLSQPPKKIKLFHLIEALEHDGVSASSRTGLHEVRKAANDGKHDASIDTGYRRVDQQLEAAEKAVEELSRIGVPEVAGVYEPPYRRRFLIAVYDHLTGGESEFYVWTAGQEPRGADLTNGPREVETFQFKFRDEASVRAALERTGDLHFGDVEPEIVEALRQDAEYTESGYWEGTYRDLVSACAPHQHDLDLLPGLARHDQGGPVAAALAMTVVDLLQPLPPPSARPVDEELLAHAAIHYAVKRTSPVTAHLAPAFAHFIAELPDQPTMLSGPRWLNPDRFDQEAGRAMSRDDTLGIALLADGTLLFKLA